MVTWNPIHDGIPFTDILAVDCFSDGRFLNATFWLSDSLFAARTNVASSKNSSEISYGMWIDADFNDKTGVLGGDFNYDIYTKMSPQGTPYAQWIEKLEQRSGSLPFIERLENRTVFSKPLLHMPFVNGKKFIQMSLDLATMGYPSKYRIVFYAALKMPNKPWKEDFTNWVSFPRPEIGISTLPSSIDMKPGETKPILLWANSSTELQPVVNLKDVRTQNVSITFQKHILHIPSSGMISTPSVIKISENASPGPTLIPITINSTVPQKNFINNLPNKNISLTPQNNEIITNGISLGINVQNPPTFWDNFQDATSKWGLYIGLVVGGAIGQIWTIVFDKINKKREQRRDDDLE